MPPAAMGNKRQTTLLSSTNIRTADNRPHELEELGQQDLDQRQHHQHPQDPQHQHQHHDDPHHLDETRPEAARETTATSAGHRPPIRQPVIRREAPIASRPAQI